MAGWLSSTAAVLPGLRTPHHPPPTPCTLLSSLSLFLLPLPAHSSTMSRQDRAITERHTKILRELVKRPENKTCSDCKHNGPSPPAPSHPSSLLTAPQIPAGPHGTCNAPPLHTHTPPRSLNPRPINSGVFLCIRCSGIHRGMGTHISKVKSIDLDTWTPEQMEVRPRLLTRAPNPPRPDPASIACAHALPLSSPSRNGATAGPTSTGKPTSNPATSLQISTSPPFSPLLPIHHTP